MEATKKLWAVLAVSAVVAGTSIEQIEPSISAPAAKAETPGNAAKDKLMNITQRGNDSGHSLIKVRQLGE